MPSRHPQELPFDEGLAKRRGPSKPALTIPVSWSAAYRRLSLAEGLRPGASSLSATKQTMETKKSGVASAVCVPATNAKDLQQCPRRSTNTEADGLQTDRPHCQQSMRRCMTGSSHVVFPSAVSPPPARPASDGHPAARPADGGYAPAGWPVITGGPRPSAKGTQGLSSPKRPRQSMRRSKHVARPVMTYHPCAVVTSRWRVGRAMHGAVVAPLGPTDSDIAN